MANQPRNEWAPFVTNVRLLQQTIPVTLIKSGRVLSFLTPYQWVFYYFVRYLVWFQAKKPYFCTPYN